MKILALDLATVAGAAWRDADGNIATLRIDLVANAGILKSKAALHHGALFNALQGAVRGAVELFGPFDVISVEDDTGLNKKTSALLAGYRAIVKLVGQELRIRVIDALDASQARATAGVGGGGTDKDIAVGNARRLYRLGNDISADEVDAAVLLIATEGWLETEPLRLANAALVKKAKAKRSRAAA